MRFNPVYRSLLLILLVTSVKVTFAAQPELGVLDDQAPWTFHTGRSYRLHPVFKSWIPCDERTTDASECFEKVYRFSQTEMDSFINSIQREISAAINQPETALRSRNALNEALILGTTLAATVRTGILLTKDAPTPWTKIAFVGLLAADGVYTYWLWDDAMSNKKRIDQATNQVNQIRAFYADELDYVARCGHPRTRFIESAAMLGIQIPFLQYAGEMLPVTNSTLDETLQNSEEFLDDCNQVALTYDALIRFGLLDTSEEIQSVYWVNLNEFYTKAFISFSDYRLMLDSGAPLTVYDMPPSFSTNVRLQSSMSDLISDFDLALKRLSPEKIAAFRNGFSQVSLRYHRVRSGHAGRNKKKIKPYEIVTLQSGNLFDKENKVLVINLIDQNLKLKVNISAVLDAVIQSEFQ